MVLKYQAGGAMGCQAGSGQGAKLMIGSALLTRSPVWPIAQCSDRRRETPDYNLPLFQARRAITAGGAELERGEVGG